MPELPEVDALAGFLRDRAVGAVVAGVELASFSVLKTFDPPLDALPGLDITGVHRHGKFLDLEVGGLHLVVHFARAGWLRWSDDLPTSRLKMGNGPHAARVRLDAGEGPGPGFDLTEAGTRKGLAVYVVRQVAELDGISALGPDPLEPGFALAPLLRRHMQIKRLLRDQSIVSGIGNAYSDEILHAARLSPFALADTLDAGAVKRLQTAVVDVLSAARDRAAGSEPGELKDDKRASMRVHGRAGEICDVCASTIAEVSFADSSLQYCPGCQTAGQRLADRRTSKFVK